MYQRANSEGSSSNETAAPTSPVSSPENGQKSEGFHFYATMKKQTSLPEDGAKQTSSKYKANDKKISTSEAANSVHIKYSPIQEHAVGNS